MTSATPAVKTRNQWWDVWDQFKTHKGALIGLCFLVFITLFVVIGPLLWTLDAGKLDVRNKDLRPFYVGLFGADVNGPGRIHWAATIWAAM